MFKNIFSVVGVIALVALACGSAYRTFGPVAPQQAPPKAIAEIPVTQHFSTFLGDVGPISGSGGIGSLVQTMPPNTGLAISRLSSVGGINFDWYRVVVIRINGTVQARERVQPPGQFQGGGGGPVIFDPPIIVRPMQTLEIFLDGSGYTSNQLTLSGYVLTAADLGL